MPKLNRWLVTSMIEDIKEFIAVANEMCSWTGKVEHLSWRFPTRCARNVNAMAIIQRHKGSAGEMYILVLEMAYDRMHFVLRLLVEFMDGYPFTDDFFNDQVARAKRPRNMSLANVIRTLWHRLKLIPETITRNMIKTKHLENSVFAGRISRGCQASGSLFYCESCTRASKAVKDLANIFSTALKGIDSSSVIVAQLEIIRSDLFEKTQWAVMTRLVEAMDADVKTLLTTTSATRAKGEADSKKHENSLQSFEAELEKHRTERTSLDMEIRRSTDQLRAVDSQLHRLKDTHKELEEENHELTESFYQAKEKLSNLEILLAVTLQQMAEMAESKLALENAVKNLREEVIAARRVSFIEIEKLGKISEGLRDEKVLMERQHHDEVEILKQKHAEVAQELQEKARSFLTEVEVQTEEQNYACEILAPQGDPEIDMALQLASNEKTVEKLTRQNERLSRTLTRLREHRRISDIRSIIDRSDRDCEEDKKF